MESKKPVVIGIINKMTSIFKRAFLICISLYSLLNTQYSFAQNPKIKCYFNHPVNNNASSGTNAVYLNGTFKDTLIAYINRAKYSIDFCVYNYYSTSGTDAINAIATAVNAAYTRGVTIRWIGNGTSSNSGWTYLNTNIPTVSSPTTSAYGISHNKFILFDVNSSNTNEPLVWTGSYNFSTQQNNTDYNNILIVQDKPLALAYYNEFNKMWGSTTATPNATNAKFGTFKTASTVNSFTVNGTPIEVYFSPKDAATSHLSTAIASANFELFFGIYTFTDNATIATGIKNRITGGVAANGIMDVFSQTYTPYTTLSSGTVMGSNLKVYNGGSSAVYHNKVMLIDQLHPASDPQVCTGSFNWTASGNTSNDENLIIVHDATIANEYYQSLCKNYVDVGGTACPSIVGIEAYDYGDQQIAVFPNPSKDVLTVKVKNAGEKLSVKVSDNLGNIVLESTVFSNDETSLNVENLSSGLYFVTIVRGDKTFTEKFLKQ